MRSKMNVVLGILAAGFLAAPMAAQAAYNYTSIDYPGAQYTQVFGINNNGQIVGTASVDGIESIGFIYDIGTATFTVLPNFPGANTGAVGISDRGVVVGGADDGVTAIGTILDNGAFSTFSYPVSIFTQARGINSPGLVTGFADDSTGNVVGFIYDPKRGSFIGFLPSPLTIAQGIDKKGNVVGSVFLLANTAFSGSPEDHYGFLRRKSGVITRFRVNGGGTRARDIADSGQVTGFFRDQGTGNLRGFVTAVTGTSFYKALTVPAANLLDMPGAIDTSPEGIDNSGNVVGIWSDGSTDHGFLASPIKQ